MTVNEKKKTTGMQLFDIINISFLVIFCLSILVPFMIVISTSISPELDITRYGYQLIPKNIDFKAYLTIFKNRKIISSLFNSFFITGLGTFIGVLVTSLMAYPLSKTDLPFNKSISFFVYFPVLFNGGFIPLYFVVKGVGLLDTRWSVILPFVITPWFLILLRNFYASIPKSLEESARLDGASEMRILISIILPLALPGIATISLFYAVNFWNQWFYPLIFIDDKFKWPIQVILRQLLTASQGITEAEGMIKGASLPEETLKMAIIIFTIFPIICVYPFIQKYFAKGMLVGAIKS